MFELTPSNVEEAMKRCGIQLTRYYTLKEFFQFARPLLPPTFPPHGHRGVMISVAKALKKKWRSKMYVVGYGHQSFEGASFVDYVFLLKARYALRRRRERENKYDYAIKFKDDGTAVPNVDGPGTTQDEAHEASA